eukprot:GFUD01063881.1.p1 GENE.GFUD01063881.1~~GFUD01063881.1.p1  ORF type:complete len:1583 (+),score=606.32 GFUD01063881.1:211-4959(+)
MVGKLVLYSFYCQGTLDSVNQLAAQTYSAFNKEGSGSRESLSSLTSQLSLTTAVESSFTSDKQQENGSSSDLLSFGSPATVTAASISSSSGQFFSLGEDDEPVSLSNNNSPAKTPTPPTGLNMTSTPATRGRRSSSSSTDAALFPIYEDPLQDSMPLFSDLESMAGSEAGWGDDSSAQLGAVSKEQLMNMLSKMRGRYHKYKGRYTDLAKAYRELEGENKKVKEVMQQTQDKALRRISELKEQGSLEKQAKAHLEEELRAELEEKQHIITTLNTKVALLKKEHVEEQPVASTLIDLSADSGNHDDIENGDKNNGRISESEKGLQLPEVDNMSVKSEDSEKLYHLEDKVKRLESLLSKCKENIKANKNKLSALTEVKEQLAVDLEAKEKELNDEKAASKKAVDELQLIKNREEGDELQMAEAKLAMHREMIMKDEEIGELRVNFNREKEEKETLEKNIEDLHKEIKEMGAAQETLEKRMEEERKSAMEELSRGKEAALDQERQRLETEKKKEVARELERQGDEWRKKIKEVEEEGRLGREELELRLSAVSKLEDKNKNKTLESTILKLETEKNKLVDQLNLSKKQILELEATKNSMNEMKAGKIIMEAKLKDVMSDMDVKKTNIIELEKTLKELTTSSTEKLNDKDKELSERLETMAKMEDSIKEHKDKVESVEKQLKYAHEEHKNNLENLKTQLLQNENLESSQIDIMVESHKTEIGEKENEIKKLHESLLTLEESAKELQERLNYNLESSMKTEEEFETKIQSLEETMRSTEVNLCTTESNLKEAEENISLKAEDLRDANEKVEDLQIHLEKMQNYEAKAKECKDFLDQKVHELRDANEELEEFKRIADEKSSLKIDLEKELHSLKEQVNSRQALHDQMVGYEKELHNRISTLENEKSGLLKVREELEDHVKSQENDIASIKQANEDEICRLKQDLEMKMRNEREKENSHKEFQKQSIEYEKKLQDQLEDKNQMVDEYKKDFERKKKELTALKESYEKEINSLERKLNEMSKNISQREMEAKNMNEKCEQLENILDEKEKLVESLEHTQTEHLSRVQTLEAELANLVENRKQLNDIIEESQKEVVSLKDNQIEMEKIQTENKKLSKSRDRLKSLLDEKEKAFTDLQGEKEKLSGSREEIDSQMKVKVDSLRDEIGKLKEIKESLVTEGNELKNNLEIVTQQASNSNLEYEKVFKEVEILKEHNKHLNSEKDILVDDKSEIDLEFKTLSEDHKNLVIEVEELKVGVEKNVQLKIDLMQANNELKTSADEVSNFKLKLKELEGMSNLSELKEENAMLIERVSQYEDEKCQIEKLSEDKWRSENEKIDHFYQREKKKLEKQIENYKIEIEILQSRDMNEETEDKIKSLVKELERKMAIMDSEHQEEFEQLQENHEIEMNRANSEHKELVGKLSSDLREKMDQFEIMDLEHQTSLRMIKEEVSEQIQLRDLKHAQALEEMNSNHKINISALEEDVHKRSGDWGWDEHQELEDLSGDSPAIFGVPNNTPHPANKGLPIKCEPSMVLEDYPEFEYLRNILYEYMMGRQPLILVKVLGAIVKFSPDQVSAIVKAEERKQSYLASLGLS